MPDVETKVQMSLNRAPLLDKGNEGLECNLNIQDTGNHRFVRHQDEYMTNKEMIDIQPQVGMYAAFARLNYKPWFAIAEFIDNSIQSHKENRKKLKALHGEVPVLEVFVEIETDFIRIKDNAGGISWKDFPRAFTPAAPPPDKTGFVRPTRFELHHHHDHQDHLRPRTAGSDSRLPRLRHHGADPAL